MLYPLTRRNPFKPVNEDYSLFSAVEILARERGLHRVPIVDKDRQLVNIITQSQVISFINDNIEKLGLKKDIPVGDISTLHSPVITIHEDETSLDAFELMNKKNVSGLAVVNDDGKLTGTISLRDLKAINSDGKMFWRLYQTVKNFMNKVKKEYKVIHNRPKKVVTVNATDTLSKAINLLDSSKVHRVFLVDENNKPISVLSIKDILLEIIEM